MSQGPENRFIASVHRLLPKAVYAEKMHNPYRGGTFDCWYSGKKGDIWVEYKWIPRIPKKGVVPELSELQKRWGRSRWGEGRKVFVVVGCPDGGALFTAPDLWEASTPASAFRELVMAKPELARWIAEQTTGTTNAIKRGHKGTSSSTRYRAGDVGYI